MRTSALLFLAFFIYLKISAQPRSNGISRKKSYDRQSPFPVSLKIRGGLSQFFGELNDQAMPGIAGIGMSYAFNKHLQMDADFNRGTLEGEKATFFNSYFVNKLSTAELLLKWNLTEQFNSLEPGKLHFWTYAGIGQIYFTAHAYNLDTGELLRFTNSPLSARNPLFRRWGRPKRPPGIRSTREGILPVGIFAAYQAGKWNLSADYRFYFARTDKLDATSGMRLVNPEEENSYSDTPNDKFGFLNFSIAYRFAPLRKKH